MEVLEIPLGIGEQQDRESLFSQLYEQAFPTTAHFVSKMGGSFQEAKDVFQDALLLYYEKLQNPGFELQTTAEAYILGISKHLWIRKFKQQRLKVSLSEAERSISIPEEYPASVDDQKLLQLLLRSGHKCMALLRAFYYEKLPMKQIAGAFGYSTDRSATVQKYKCLEKVRDTIKEKSIGYEDFLN